MSQFLAYNSSSQTQDLDDEMRIDPGLRRPFFDSKGRACVTVNSRTKKYDETLKRLVPVQETHFIKDLVANGIHSPVFNATSLRKEDWLLLDSAVLKVARKRLRAWGDLASRNTKTVDGMRKTILEHETMSDPGEAMEDMDGLAEGRDDTPVFQLQGLPLSITHSDFWLSKRQLMVSRNSGEGLDVIKAEAAARRVAERIEKVLIGVETGLTYGGNSTQVGGYGRASTVYGYTNFPPRLTKSNLTIPTGSNPEATVADVLAMRQQLADQNFFGPFILYTSTDWDLYLDNDYARLGGNNANMSLRQRLEGIDGIEAVRRLDYLTAAASHAFTMILVQMTPDVARAINGMDITTVQWQSQGGMRENFKVMGIQVPQLRADYLGQCGLLHATTA